MYFVSRSRSTNSRKYAVVELCASIFSFNSSAQCAYIKPEQVIRRYSPSTYMHSGPLL